MRDLITKAAQGVVVGQRGRRTGVGLVQSRHVAYERVPTTIVDLAQYVAVWVLRVEH